MKIGNGGKEGEKNNSVARCHKAQFLMLRSLDRHSQVLTSASEASGTQSSVSDSQRGEETGDPSPAVLLCSTVHVHTVTEF